MQFNYKTSLWNCTENDSKANKTALMHWLEKVSVKALCNVHTAQIKSENSKNIYLSNIKRTVSCKCILALRANELKELGKLTLLVEIALCQVI